MILTILLSLSICELLCFDTAATVIFTVIFCLCSYVAIIWCKLTFALDEEEVEAIRSYIRRAREIKKRLRVLYSRQKQRVRVKRAPL